LTVANCQQRGSDWLKVVFTYHGKYKKNNEIYRVWQPSNHPKILLHPRFTKQKLNYIHNNPVKALLVENPEDYLFSSAKDYCGKKGMVNIELMH